MKKRFTEEAIEIARRIGYFYEQKNYGDIREANDEMAKLKIEDIKVSDECVEIHTARPGILIGRMGESISNLQAYLGVKINVVEVDSISDYMTVYDPEDYF